MHLQIIYLNFSLSSTLNWNKIPTYFPSKKKQKYLKIVPIHSLHPSKILDTLSKQKKLFPLFSKGKNLSQKVMSVYRSFSRLLDRPRKD